MTAWTRELENLQGNLYISGLTLPTITLYNCDNDDDGILHQNAWEKVSHACPPSNNLLFLHFTCFSLLSIFF